MSDDAIAWGRMRDKVAREGHFEGHVEPVALPKAEVVRSKSRGFWSCLTGGR